MSRQRRNPGSAEAARCRFERRAGAGNADRDGRYHHGYRYDQGNRCDELSEHDRTPLPAPLLRIGEPDGAELGGHGALLARISASTGEHWPKSGPLIGRIVAAIQKIFGKPGVSG
jgi:hypothetical protein